jgi:ribose transport system substrate-binding protein
MKKVLFVTCLLIMAFSVSMLSAAAEEESGQEKLIIGFSQGTMNHPWRVAMVEGNKTYAAENYPEVELIVTDGQNNSSKQVADVESLMARGIDVLIISPLTAEALTGVVGRVMDEGIKVVTLDRKVNIPVDLHVGGENRPIGTYAAAWLNEKLGGTGNIIEIGGTAGASATVDRHEGFHDQLAEYAGLNVLATQYCDYLREPAMGFMEDMLQRYGSGEINAVYAHNDEMAMGAYKAIEAAGREDEVLIIGVDGQNSAIDSIADGTMDLTITYPFCAPEGIMYAYKLAVGGNLSSEIVLENQPIDSSNVAEWIGKGF